jgi:hypothetical protein
MSSFPRRSARLSPHLSQDQRSFISSSTPSLHHLSQPSSTSTTSHPSPSNQSLNPPPPPPTPQNTNGLKVQPSFMPNQPSLQVPLPSPSANDVNPFFGRPSSQPNPYSQQPNFPHSQPEQMQIPQQQTLMPEQPPQFHPHANSLSQSHPQNMRDLTPGQLPPDFLAEAAKRAQIACLMRDMGDVSL